MKPREIEDIAKDFRMHVRAKAGLHVDWDTASDGMKEWYRVLAKRSGERLFTINRRAKEDPGEKA